MSKRTAAKLANISEGRWRQVVTGVEKVRAGVTVPANPKRETVISMAEAVGADVDAALRAANMEPRRPRVPNITSDWHLYREALTDPDLQLVVASLMKLPPEARRQFAAMIDKYGADLAAGRAVDLAQGDVIEVPAEDVPDDGPQTVVAIVTRRDDPAFGAAAAYRTDTPSVYERQADEQDEAGEAPDAPGPEHGA